MPRSTRARHEVLDNIATVCKDRMMTRKESLEASALLLALAVVVLVVGLAVHLNPGTVTILVVVFAAVIGPPVAIRWAKRHRSATGD